MNGCDDNAKCEPAIFFSLPRSLSLSPLRALKMQFEIVRKMAVLKSLYYRTTSYHTYFSWVMKALVIEIGSVGGL